jgi:peptidoglycan-N-acetylmuramic acid deacetylase
MPTDPTVETQPETKPTEPNLEYIGNLYTRQELEAMENVRKPYSFGNTSGGKPAPNAVKTQNAYGQYAGNFIGPDNGCIYLTFDCGYEYQNLTADILDTLKEKNVKAVFFITMSYAKKNPELVQRMIDEGHAVGNHTNNHPVMPKQSIDTMVYEVMSLHDYVKEHFGYTMTLFRPPTGAFSVQSLSVLKSLGYKTMLWSFHYYDYDTEDQMAVSKALEKVTNSHHNGAIYLLHAISTTNAALLPDAIDFFQTQGYTLELFQ